MWFLMLFVLFWLDWGVGILRGVYFFELGIFFTLCGAQLIHVNYDIIS